MSSCSTLLSPRPLHTAHVQVPDPYYEATNTTVPDAVVSKDPFTGLWYQCPNYYEIYQCPECRDAPHLRCRAVFGFMFRCVCVCVCVCVLWGGG